MSSRRVPLASAVGTRSRRRSWSKWSGCAYVDGCLLAPFSRDSFTRTWCSPTDGLLIRAITQSYDRCGAARIPMIAD